MFRIGTVLVVVGGVGTWTVVPVVAGPSTSPSARAAARLKHRPPGGWINHYLPEDRYKIKGGIWKYVSTEADDNYHRPDSAEMLSQPAGLVIGFASVADAEEAGYRPGRSVTLRDRENGRVVGRPNRGARMDVGGVGQRTSDTVTVPIASIPRHIFAFIRLVDALADKIDNASGRQELLRLDLTLDRLKRDFESGSASAYLGGAQVGSDLGSMLGTLMMLSRAIDAKRRPNNFGIPFDRQLLSAARSGARAMIPQMRQLFRQKAQENGDQRQWRGPR